MTFTPTRAMDMAVARTLLNALAHTGGGWYSMIRPDGHTIVGMRKAEAERMLGSYYHHITSPTWATTGELIEAMAAKGWVAEIYSPGGLINDEMGVFAERWTVYFHALSRRDLKDGDATGDTLPAAVAEAVIRALGLEGEG